MAPNMESQHKKFNRRQFLGRSIGGTGMWALSGAALAALGQAAAAADSSGNPFAYDVDRLNHVDPELIKYEQVARFSSSGQEPRRLAVGPGDKLYVAGSAGVTILDKSGTKLDQINTTSAARCVAVAAEQTVYVGLRSHIEVFDRNGQPRATWEAPTKKTWFTGLCVSPDELFAADSANRVILRYNLAGKIVGRIGQKDPGHNVPGLIVPSPYLDVKLGRDGLLRVNNPGRHCVEVFTTTGDLEFSWGKPSLAIEGFCGCCNPVGLAMLPDGSCVTCEKGVPRVKVYSADRGFSGVVAGPELFQQNGRPGQVSERSDGTLGGLDAAADSQGRVYILDLVAGDIRVMKLKT